MPAKAGFFFAGIRDSAFGIGKNESESKTLQPRSDQSQLPNLRPQSNRLIVKLPYTGVSRWVSNSRVRWYRARANFQRPYITARP
ncbi:hypothetical protein PD5205_00577 [Xanthomonas fragariae]|uniref:Uncharacterized protein n=1 Tax=Xanthomonas fragariae TaxID=48664 RepID=A0A1Y6GZP5_9XANT|nr:hypothetical protein NBC2815_03439 [Xanthomonas fragariae]SMR00654.1 hypothetical protein PD885_03433 [Xanthomonas fragariae]SMR01897.1 hypothetical protein PD5205_00577 [Xanthomonas fragariae]